MADETTVCTAVYEGSYLEGLTRVYGLEPKGELERGFRSLHRTEKTEY